MVKKNKEEPVKDLTLGALINDEVIHLTLNNENSMYNKVSLENISMSILSKLDAVKLLSFHFQKYYLNKPYDRINIEGLDFLITNITKSSISLIYIGISD